MLSNHPEVAEQHFPGPESRLNLDHSGQRFPVSRRGERLCRTPFASPCGKDHIPHSPWRLASGSEIAAFRKESRGGGIRCFEGYKGRCPTRSIRAPYREHWSARSSCGSARHAKAPHLVSTLARQEDAFVIHRPPGNSPLAEFVTPFDKRLDAASLAGVCLERRIAA